MKTPQEWVERFRQLYTRKGESKLSLSQIIAGVVREAQEEAYAEGVKAERSRCRDIAVSELAHDVARRIVDGEEADHADRGQAE